LWPKGQTKYGNAWQEGKDGDAAHLWHAEFLIILTNQSYSIGSVRYCMIKRLDKIGIIEVSKLLATDWQQLTSLER
jgi:hypothetical protein